MNDRIPQVKILGPSIKHEGTFKGRDGETIEYVTKKQPAVMIRGDFREPYDVRLEADQSDYPVGTYDLDVCSMLVISKGAHGLGKFTRLLPSETARK